MRYLYLTLLLVGLLSSSVHAQVQSNWRWSRAGGPNVQEGFNQKITSDRMGNQYVLVTFTGRMDIGIYTFIASGTGADIVVFKYDPNGNIVWGKQIFSSGSLNGYDIKLDANQNIYIAGVYSGTITSDQVSLNMVGESASTYIIKLDPHGHTLWGRVGGSSSIDFGMSIAPSPDGSVYLVGMYLGASYSTGGFSAPNAGGWDVFVARINGSNGAVNWLRRGGGAGPDIAMDAATDSKGGLYVTGYFSDGAVFGSQTLNTEGDFSPYLAVYAPNGTVQKIIPYLINASKGTQYIGTRVRLDQNEDIYWLLQGDLSQNNSASALFYYPNSAEKDVDYRWSRAFAANAGAAPAYGLATDGSNVYVSGTFQGGTAAILQGAPSGFAKAEGSDMYLVSYDNNGGYRFGEVVAWNGNENNGGVTVSGVSQVFVTGTYGTNTYRIPGLADLPSNQNKNYFVARYGSTQVDYSLRFSGEVPSSLCAGEFFQTSYAATGDFPDGSTLQLQLSDRFGNFTNPTVIGEDKPQTPSGTILGQIPAGVIIDKAYRLRLVVSSPYLVSNPSNTININQSPTAPLASGASRCGTGSVTLSASGAGTGESYRWYALAQGGTVLSTNASYITPSLSSTTTYYVAKFNTNLACESVRVPVTATINPLPAAPTAPAVARCGPGTVTLTATGAPTGGNYRWYAASTGGTPLAVGASYSPTISSNTTFYVVAVSTASCESSPRTAVNATVNPIPAAPLTDGEERCGPGVVTLVARGAPIGGSYRWYTSSTGGTAIPGQITATYSPTISANTTFYVSTVSSASCESATRTAVTGFIFPLPDAPKTSNESRCGPGSVTLAADGLPTGGAFRWYTQEGKLLEEETSGKFVTPELTETTTFMVATVSRDGCESEVRNPSIATINPIPAAPATTGTDRCGPGSVTLTAAGTPAGGSYRWYNVSTGGTAIGGQTAATYNTPSLAATTTYYVSTVSSAGCESATRTAVTATINPIPAAPTTTGADRCGPGSVTLTAAGTPAGGSYRWYNVSTGGTAIGGQTAATYNTPSLAATTTYFVSTVSSAGCESATRTAVTATINPIPTAPTTTGAERCGTGTVTLTAAGTPAGGSYRWYNVSTGGTAIGGQTAATYNTPSLAATTTYYVSTVSSAGCESATRTAVSATINPIPAAPTTTGADRCGPGSVTLTAAGTPAGGSYRWYTVSTGGTAIGGQTAATYNTPSLSATNTYYVSTVSSAGCESATRTAVTATINPIPAAPTTTGAERCGPGSVTLTAAGTPAGGSYRWYTVSTGGTAIGGQTAATYNTPSLSATNTYYVSTVSSAGCESATRTAVTATINPIPAAPTTTGADRCGPGSVTLTAAGTPAGGSYRWYNVSTGGTAIGGQTAATYNTPSLAATTTYYVSTVSSAGCESATRTAVSATINPIPTAPTTTGAERCGTGTVTLTAAGTPAGGSYRWYTVSTGGTAIGGQTAATYNTPSLAATTTYYVSTVSSAGCESATRTAVTATINPIPAAPTTTGADRCGPGSVTLTAAGTPAGGSYRWYTVSTGGTAIGGQTAATYNTPSLSATNTYYVSTVSSAGCESATRTAVTATINPIPAAPTTTGAERCGTGTVTLTAAGTPAGGSYRWYTVSTGGTAIGGQTAATYNTPSLSATNTYYVSTVSSAGCESTTRTPVTATINPIPNTPGTTGAVACSTSSLTLGASGAQAGESYRWYTVSTGGTPIGGATGATYTTPILSASATYYVSILSAAGCEGNRASVSATIQNLQKPNITAPNGTQYCENGTIPLMGPAGFSIYSWSNGAFGSQIEVGQVTGLTLTVQDANGCVSVASDPINTSLAPAAIAEISFNGNSLLASAGTSYQWYFFTTTLTGQTGQTLPLNPLQFGEYTVRVTNEFGCSSLSSVFEYLITADLEVEKSPKIVAYPNPVEKTIHLQNLSNDSHTRVKLVDQWGRILKEISAEQITDLDVSDLRSGVYTLLVYEKGGVQHVKFVKK